MSDEQGVANAVGRLVLIFSCTLLGPFVGYITGGAIQWIFSETMPAVMNALGIKGITLSQLGAFLGFVGAFLTTGVVNLRSGREE